MERKQIYKELGANIKRARCRKGWTQQEFADRIGISLQFACKIETGFSKPSLDTLIDTAYSLDIPLKELFSFD